MAANAAVPMLAMRALREESQPVRSCEAGAGVCSVSWPDGAVVAWSPSAASVLRILAV